MRTVFTVTKPQDFIALAPIVLGFHPDNSVVMLTIEAFGARADVPAPDQIDNMIESLLTPAKHHNVRQVAFLIYNDQDNTDLKHALCAAFDGAGIRIIAALEVRGDKYRPFSEVDWQDFDVTSHPFTLQAQYDDHAPRASSREELWTSIKPSGSGWSGEVAEKVAELREIGPEAMVMTLKRDEKVAEQAALWKAALHGADECDSDTVEAIAIVTGFALWLAGDGASAWHVLDHNEAHTKLHGALSWLLNDAVSPDDWPL